MVFDVELGQGQAEEMEQAGEMGQVLSVSEFVVETVLVQGLALCEFAAQGLAGERQRAP